MIKVTDLTVHYGKQPALESISFTVGRGEFVLLSGPSGCGKSTLARSLNGLIPHASSARMTGRVVVDGLDTAAHALPELAAHVGLVFQNPATQLFNAIVEEEVAFAPRNLGLPGEEVAVRVAFALDATGIVPLRDRAIRTLSSGEQQRVAIASVLALRPQVLVLDEPTSNLDWRGVEQVMSTLARLHRQQGLTILVIEHRLQAVVPLAERVLLMQGGRIVADGRPEDVFADKERLITLGLRYPWMEIGDWILGIGDRRSVVGCAQDKSGGPSAVPLTGSGQAPSTGSPRLCSRQAGQAPSSALRTGVGAASAGFPRQEPTYPLVAIRRGGYRKPPYGVSRQEPTYPLVAIQGLEAGYGRRTVLQGLDLALYPGEFVALVGDNGAGKSTLARVLAGLLRPRQGRITWNEKLRRLPPGRRVGFLFQNPLDQLVCDTVEEEIAFGPRNFGLPVEERLETTLAAADLMALRHRRSAALSVGEQQRTALAAALSTDPPLLILDEPTMGQDWAHLSLMMESLIHLNHNGQAILLITHDDKLVCRYARRIILLKEGRIGGEWRMANSE